MKIEVTFKAGTLKMTQYHELYDKLKQIDYSERHKLLSMMFNIDQEYIFKGSKGELTVTFDKDDLA